VFDLGKILPLKASLELGSKKIGGLKDDVCIFGGTFLWKQTLLLKFLPCLILPFN